MNTKMRIFKKKADRYGTHIFTFPNGKKLFQIKEEYFEKLPAEKLRSIQENSNYIAFLGISKTTLEAGHSMIKRIANEISVLSDNKSKAEREKKIQDLNRVIDQIDTTRKEYDHTNEAIMVSLFDLFYYLEGETPFIWSEQNLEAKRYYLNEYPYFRSFFFQKLNDFTTGYKVTYQNCINLALAQSTIQEVVKDLNLTNTSEHKTN